MPCALFAVSPYEKKIKKCDNQHKTVTTRSSPIMNAKATATAWSAAIVLPLLYVVPLLAGYKPTRSKTARDDVFVKLAGSIALLAALAMAFASFGTLKRAPLAAVTIMLIGAFVFMMAQLYTVAAGMAGAPLAARALTMYALPLAGGATIGSSIAAGLSIATAFGAPALARTLAALVVPAVFLPLALPATPSNPYYHLVDGALKWFAKATAKPRATAQVTPVPKVTPPATTPSPLRTTE